jgi:phage shock protein C
MKRFDRKRSRGLYRSRNSALLGVCRGIAEYFDFSVIWVRTIAIALFIFTGFWPVVVLYLLAGLLMKPEPVIPFRDAEEQEFYDSYTTSRHRAVQRLKQRFDRLERRIRRMEHVVTSADFEWDRRMHR